MKRFLAIAIAASVGLLWAGSALAATNDNPTTIGSYTAGEPANGIAKSRHNLGTFAKHIGTSGTTEICIFCHTPHHTNTSATPLWNRAATDQTTYSAAYTAYGTTMAGSNVTTLGSTTLACLSCHDGVTTFDNIVNAPGKDGVTVGGKSRGWSFSEDATTVSGFLTSNRLNIGNGLNGSASSGYGYGGTGLRDDHPVSITYTAGNASLRPTGTTISGIDLAAGLSSTNLNIVQNLWAVKGYFNSSATIQDLLRGAAPSGGPNMGNAGTNVECSSCHDPHFKNNSWDEVEDTWNSMQEDEGDGLFLRRVGGNTGSGVCRTCHNK